MKFRDCNDNEIDLVSEVSSRIRSGYDYTIYIGTDSQLHKAKKQICYATVVVLHKKKKGGIAFVKRVKEPSFCPLSQRLKTEVWKSLEVAFSLVSSLPSNVEIVLHVDCNTSKSFKSGKYYEELVGMVTGQGFKCVVKPDAFAAQSVADKYSR